MQVVGCVGTNGVQTAGQILGFRESALDLEILSEE
jgi:hypothetical protein